ncbi:MAG: hypothetical protein M3198_11740 [Actinomycetota bacterium]|nr:hypothetical protein [Actinomycetota bacterium]
MFTADLASSTSWWETAGAGALIGAAGVALGAAISPVLERRFSRRKMLEEAHLRAADKHAERVASIYRIVDELAYYALGEEAGVIDPEGSRNLDPISHAGGAISRLRDLRAAHPTAAVRRAARSLEDDLRGFYGNPPPGGTMAWPAYEDRDELLRHQQQADELIELLHVAPAPRMLSEASRAIGTLIQRTSRVGTWVWIALALLGIAAIGYLIWR